MQKKKSMKKSISSSNTSFYQHNEEDIQMRVAEPLYDFCWAWVSQVRIEQRNSQKINNILNSSKDNMESVSQTGTKYSSSNVTEKIEEFETYLKNVSKLLKRKAFKDVCQQYLENQDTMYPGFGDITLIAHYLLNEKDTYRGMLNYNQIKSIDHALIFQFIFYQFCDWMLRTPRGMECMKYILMPVKVTQPKYEICRQKFCKTFTLEDNNIVRFALYKICKAFNTVEKNSTKNIQKSKKEVKQEKVEVEEEEEDSESEEESESEDETESEEEVDDEEEEEEEDDDEEEEDEIKMDEKEIKEGVDMSDVTNIEDYKYENDSNYEKTKVISLEPSSGQETPSEDKLISTSKSVISSNQNQSTTKAKKTLSQKDEPDNNFMNNNSKVISLLLNRLNTSSNPQQIIDKLDQLLKSVEEKDIVKEPESVIGKESVLPKISKEELQKEYLEKVKGVNVEKRQKKKSKSSTNSETASVMSSASKTSRMSTLSVQNIPKIVMVPVSANNYHNIKQQQQQQQHLSSVSSSSDVSELEERSDSEGENYKDVSVFHR
jgi:hypothetical protein